jgi:hypothetical protein
MVAHFDERFDERPGEAEAIEIFQVIYLSSDRDGAKSRTAARGFYEKGNAPRVRASVGTRKGARQEDIKSFTRPARIDRMGSRYS